MLFMKVVPRSIVLVYAFTLCTIGMLSFATCLAAADAPERNKSGSGKFVSFQGGTLTIRAKSGNLSYENVGENYKTYHNNEEGPGSRLVDTVKALSGEKLPGNIVSLSRVLPGTLVRVNVEEREIHLGLDHRIIGTLVSYQDGKLQLVAAEVPQGFVQKPAGKILLAVDPGLPVLESIDGGDLKFAGLAGEVLKSAKPGATITARSSYDVDVVEVLEIGVPKRRMERYIGESRGTVRGTLVSFKNDILRINGKSVSALDATDYERVIARRITPDMPILESIDGAAYKPATIEALKNAREGTVVTIRKVEDIILDIQVGLPKDSK